MKRPETLLGALFPILEKLNPTILLASAYNKQHKMRIISNKTLYNYQELIWIADSVLVWSIGLISAFQCGDNKT